MLSSKIQVPLIDMVTVPASSFLMGRDYDNPQKDIYGGREHPAHEVDLPEFQISRFPITNWQYVPFVKDTGHQEPYLWQKNHSIPEGRDEHPVSGMTWTDAWLFCAWLRHKTGLPYHLPTEAEWEKAATWNPDTKQKQKYPWGDTFDDSRCNVVSTGINNTTPVGKYSPYGDSPYGCADMTGNVNEWCNSVMTLYPYDMADGREEFQAEMITGVPRRVIRGGDWYTIGEPSPVRRNAPSSRWRALWGFRVALGESLSDAHKEFETKRDLAIAELEKAYREKIDADLTNAEIWFSRGSERIKLQRYDLAPWAEIEHDNTQALKYQDRLTVTPIGWVFYNRGLARFRQDKFRDAMSDLDTAIDHDSNDADAYRLRAEIAIGLGDWSKAKDDLEHVTEIRPQKDWEAFMRVKLLEGQGRESEAIELYSQLINKPLWACQSMPELYLRRGRLYDTIGQHEKALSDYCHYILMQPDSEESASLMGLMG